MLDWLGVGRDAGDELLWAAALALCAAAVGLVAVTLGVRGLRRDRMQLTVDAALARRREAAPPAGAPAGPRRWYDGLLAAAAAQGRRWREGRWGESLLPESERALVDVCGFADVSRARALYVFVRLWLPVLLPLAGWLLFGGWRPLGSWLLGVLCIGLAGFAVGWLLPKWYVQRRAAARRAAVKEELPLFIDLLRLLQGVGLSIDQALHVIIADFREVMPALAFELGIAVQRHDRGVDRAQSLARIATGFGNDDLAAIARLIVQVDEHGGAVQEPLRQFSERLREQRRMELKEIVGLLTVKMTGVMVLTLLPALLIVTGGAGFLALFRGLARVVGG